MKNKWRLKPVVCVIWKYTSTIFTNFSECKNCNTKRSLRCYYENKDLLPNQPKIY